MVSHPSEVSKGDELLTAVELYDRFGGSFIEEVREYGSAKV
jgi:hypothetical protein